MDPSSLNSVVIPSQFRNLRVLLVESDNELLSYHAALLTNYSYQVTTTLLPSTAIAMISSGCQYDLVLADADMKETDALVFIKRIIDLRKDFPIIMMVSNGSYIYMAHEALKRKAFFCIGKPCRTEDILNVWQYVCQKKTSITDSNGKETSLPVATANKPSGSYNTYRTWTPELHKKFLEAVYSLGGKDAHAKDVLKRMDTPEVTHRQVASHLQKYRLKTSEEEERCCIINWLRNDTIGDQEPQHSFLRGNNKFGNSFSCPGRLNYSNIAYMTTDDTAASLLASPPPQTTTDANISTVLEPNHDFTNTSPQLPKTIDGNTSTILEPDTITSPLTSIDNNTSSVPEPNYDNFPTLRRLLGKTASNSSRGNGNGAFHISDHALTNPRQEMLIGESSSNLTSGSFTNPDGGEDAIEVSNSSSSHERQQKLAAIAEPSFPFNVDDFFMDDPEVSNMDDHGLLPNLSSNEIDDMIMELLDQDDPEDSSACLDDIRMLSQWLAAPPDLDPHDPK